MTQTLEKNKKYYISAIFNNTGNFSLNEDLSTVDDDIKSLVDGENIIGIVEGTFFVPDGFSRNDRFYPKELWTNQLVNEDVQRRLGGSTMFGCIGHSAGPVTEEDLSTGKVSHFMQKLWIDENTGMGMGRACILNTPAGKNLKTYLKAGCKLKVSSRGEGSFAEGIEKDGHPVVEAKSYNLITFDFVIEPGFTETDPQLHENYIEESLIIEKENTNDNDNKGESDMDMTQIVEDYKSAKEQAEKNLQEQKESFDSERANLNEQLKKATERASAYRKSLNEIQKSSSLSKVKSSRDAQRIKNLASVVEGYKKLGSIDEIKRASVLSQATYTQLNAYKKLGKVDELAEMLESYEKIISELESYRKLGSLSDVKRMYESAIKYTSMKKSRTILEQAKAISKISGKSVESSMAMIERYGFEKANEIVTRQSKRATAITEKVDTDLKTTNEVETDEVSEAQVLAEAMFADYNASMFISEEEKEEPKKKEETETEKEEKSNVEMDDEEDENEEELEDEELEDRVDNIQAQVDTLATAFEQITGEDPFSANDEENEEPVDADYDFDIEDAEK